MKNSAGLASAALLAIALTTPAAFADSVKQAPTAVAEKTEKFAAPFASTCSVTEARNNAACNDNAPQKNVYPSAPVFPQFGI